MSNDAGGIDDWLGTAGFVDAELDTTDWLDFDRPGTTPREDPWADIDVGLPTLTSAQREFLSGDDHVPSTEADLADADAEIIAIPDDPDEIDPFEATDR